MVDFREHFSCKFEATEPKYLGSTKILISECWWKNIFLRFIGSHITASERHRFRLTNELSEMIDFRKHFRCKFGATEPNYSRSTECQWKNVFHDQSLHYIYYVFLRKRYISTKSHMVATTIVRSEMSQDSGTNHDMGNNLKRTRDIQMKQELNSQTKPILSCSCPAGIHTAEIVYTFRLYLRLPSGGRQSFELSESPRTPLLMGL